MKLKPLSDLTCASMVFDKSSIRSALGDVSISGDGNNMKRGVSRDLQEIGRSLVILHGF
jgi:hypothetical protein